jgi:hypothetical protein
MRTTLLPCLVLGIAACLATGCRTQRPVLYPNSHWNAVGPEVARSDTDRCIQFAKDFAGRGSQTVETAEEAAKGAVRGGAVGGAAGAVWGRAGRGAASAAAGAATSAVVNGLFRSRQLDPIERRFTETCLRELGYKPAGWR